MKRFILLFVLSLSAISYSQTLLETIDLPAGTFYNYGYGLVYNDGKYWISSGSSTAGLGIINAVDATGAQVATINITYPGMQESQGLAFDGTNFWYIDRKTARCDIFKVSPVGTVLDSITSSQLFGSSVYMGGAAWDGTGLWISLYYPNTSAALYKVDVNTKTIIDTIQTYGTQPEGITVKGDTLLYSMDDNEGDPEKIFAVDLATKDTLFSFPVPDPNGQSPRGLAWDGTYFWLLAEPVGGTINQRQLFKYDLGGSGTPHIVTASIVFFPNTTVGNPSDYILTIQNTGNATLTVNSLTIVNNVFSYSGVTPPFDITAGSSQQVTLTFSPAGYSYSNGTLIIDCNDPVTPTVNVGLSGQGVLPGARIGFTSTSHNFGDVWVGQEGVAFWKFKTFNMGDTPLDITNMSFNLAEFTFDSPAIPFTINSTDSVELTVYFYPTTTGSYSDSLSITNSDLTNPLAKIAVQGNGVFNNYNYGYTFWQYQVPPHPNSTSAEPRVEGLKPINDITGDGIPEVIISTENYWTMCLNGAASGTPDPIWIFTTYMGSNNTGSIGANFEYGVQDAIQISDVTGDGWDDVILAVGGGNEHVYVLNGNNGQIVWSFGDDINYDLGDFEAVDCSRDFTGDGIKDVLAIADGNNAGTGHKSAYLFNGPDGTIIWQHQIPGPNPSFGKAIISIHDLNGDNLPDVVIGYGNNGSSDLSVRGLNGTNGNELWTRNMVLYEPKELLELPLPNGSSDVIAAEYFNRIHRLRGGDGTIIWTQFLGSSAGMIQISLINDVNSDQVPDVLVASFSPTGLNCLSGATGDVIWSYPMVFQFGVTSIPDIDNDGVDDVIAGDQDGTLYCINGKGDSLIFSKNYPGDWIYTVNKMPSIDGNGSYEILTGTKNGKVVCLSGGLNVIPVEMNTFTASVADGKVLLNWSTASETNNYGFEVERKNGNSSWNKIGFVPGTGTTTQMHSYSYTDENVSAGDYSYRLKQVDFDGSFEYSQVVEAVVGGAYEFALEQNYPNPFNPLTNIKYSLKAKSYVELKVINLLGEEVKTLVSEEQQAGSYTINFDASSLASGIYFYTLKAGDFVSTKKMILLK